MKDQQRTGAPDVEELPDSVWDEIEGAVFAELEAEHAVEPTATPPLERSRASWVAVAAAVLAVGSGVWVANNSGSGPTTQSTRFSAGAEGGRLMLDEVGLELGPFAEGVAVGSSGSGWVVALDHGSVEFAVPPRSGRPAFVVQAGDVRVEVVGTRFVVARQEQSVQVDVSRGVVRVLHDGEEVRLAASGHWTNQVPSPESNETPTEGETGDHTHDGTRGMPDDADEDGVPVGSPTPSGLAGSALAGSRGHRREASESTAEAFDRATTLEASNPSAALQLYREVEQRGGAWSEAALYARGRLELESGSAQVAARLLNQYLRRHPNGINAHDARLLLDTLPPNMQ